MSKNTTIGIVVLAAVILIGAWFAMQNPAPSTSAPAATSTPAPSTSAPAPLKTAPKTGGTVPAGGTATPQAVKLPSPPAPIVYFRGGNPLDLIEVNLNPAYAAAYWPKYFSYLDVYRAVNAGGPWTRIYRTPGSTPMVKDSGYQTDAHNLYYRVVAVDINGGESAPSPTSRVIFP